jgi:hypothetical protein
MSKIEDGNLSAAYFAHLPQIITEEGFPNAPIWSLNHTGELTYIAVHGLSPEQIINVAHDILADLSCKEIVFAIDRFTKPGQGTKYDDVLTIYWWYGPHEAHAGWRFGVVNYKQGDPPIIEPIDWDNEFWNDIMWRGMKSRIDQVHKTIERLKQTFTTHGMDKALEILRRRGANQDQIDVFLRTFGNL